MQKAYTLALLLTAAAVGATGMERRDGSTITVSTTQFNPQETNQGGTTNSAGTFNVSPLATSSSYQFQTLSQTSTFALSAGGAANTQSPSSGNSGSGSGGSGNSGSGSSGNIGGGTIVVTATAPTSTVNMFSTGASRASSTGVVTASNGLPSLALGASNGALANAGADKAVYAAVAAVALGALYGALVVA